MKKSPFPGMDPWLEWHWGDVHTSLTTYARDQIQSQLPDGLRARVEEYVAVESWCDDESPSSPTRMAPDVRIVERPRSLPDWDEGGGVATAVEVEVEIDIESEPVLVQRVAEPQTLRSIQIIDSKSGQRVVTSIEFLSQANKCSEAGRKQFRDKQERLLEGDVNLVEIDLLRAGKWVLAAQEGRVPKSCRSPYRICVVRAESQHAAEVYRVSLRAPLPSIRIPLRPGDADVRLNLQAVIEAAYLNGGYDDIDYSQPPHPPLTGADAEWAAARLRDKGVVPTEGTV